MIYGLRSSIAHATARPAIIFFHGGGWLYGNRWQFARQAARLTRETNLIVISADYTLDGNPVTSSADALAATCWIRDRVRKFGIDSDRIAISGGSAGGQLAAYVGLSKRSSAGQCADASYPYADALILFNPLLDFRDMKRPMPEAGLADVSPIKMLDRRIPPTLILQGTADKTTPIASAYNFANKAKGVGSPIVRVVPFEGRNHGFFNIAESGDLNTTIDDVEHFLRELGWIN